MALRERDAEIGQLRDTLERNEAAIFTVYEEKERAWEREVRKLRALYETRLRASQQKALNTLTPEIQNPDGGSVLWVFALPNWTNGAYAVYE